MSKLAPTLQAFFTDRLMGQRQASPHTIAGYRDTFRLLLRFATDRTRTPAMRAGLRRSGRPADRRVPDHLETERGNRVRTRNPRLAAIHSLFGYAALHHPEHAASIQRVLAIPPKRFERNLVTFLTDDEVDALLAACDRSTWTGRRDHAMLTLAIQTGLRISELTGLTCADVVLGAGAHVRCLGKGRKQRHTPLLPLTVAVLRVWLTERHGSPSDPLFPTSTGRATQPRRHRAPHQPSTSAPPPRPAPRCAPRRSALHTLRHTAAMRLLHSGVDITVIALWLGHEQVTTTNIYLHADMSQKERAIARTTPPDTTPGRYRAPDTLLAFLEAL